MRLNSSKQAQAPDAARPLKNLAMILPNGDKNGSAVQKSREKRKHSGLLYQGQLLTGRRMLRKLAGQAVSAPGVPTMACEAWRWLPHIKVLGLWFRHAAEVQDMRLTSQYILSCDSQAKSLTSPSMPWAAKLATWNAVGESIGDSRGPEDGADSQNHLAGPFQHPLLPGLGRIGCHTQLAALLDALCHTSLHLHPSTPATSSAYALQHSQLKSWGAGAPSKHFLRWGWTLVGSLVSDKISSISSLDRKKKRGNAILLTSRVSSHSSASFSRGPMKGDALMDCVFTIWSSRMACTMRQDCQAQLASLGFQLGCNALVKKVLNREGIPDALLSLLDGTLVILKGILQINLHAVTVPVQACQEKDSGNTYRVVLAAEEGAVSPIRNRGEKVASWGKLANTLLLGGVGLKAPGFRPEGFPSKKWLKPRINSRRGAAWVRVMLPSMLLLFSTSSTAFLSGVKAMPSSANDTVVRKTPCTQQGSRTAAQLQGVAYLLHFL
ncbi:MAG: hypothetical protein FRX49_03712 [Trebouxia sp. A1-2]|nr:MAG: hypothetical protein FRX49_03712 [Trebouxia sp. A1-2]